MKIPLPTFPSVHRLRSILSIGALLLVAVSPFITYEAVHAARSKPTPAWPGDVALVSTSGGEMVDLGLLHFPTAVSTKGGVIARFPLNTLLDVPNNGRLRASTAFRIGGAKLVGAGLDNSLASGVPFWIEVRIPADTTQPKQAIVDNLGGHRSAVLDVFNSATSDVSYFPAPGLSVIAGKIQQFVIDEAKLLHALKDPSLRATPSASPSPSPSETASSSSKPIPHKDISVQVINQGGLVSDAQSITTKLEKAGYTTEPPSNSTKAPVKGITVYYAYVKLAGDEVARSLGVHTASLLPHGYPSHADVVVVSGG